MAKSVSARPAAFAERVLPLAGRHGGSGIASIQPAEPAFRTALRARPDVLATLSKALGVELPVKPKSSATVGTRTALWLGPDEWLVIDTGSKDPAADLAKATVLHSAVDVSQRNTAIVVSGPGAEAVINAGCPQDLALAAFPVSAVSRTLLGKIEIVLWRNGENSFRVECWRSFSDYAFTFLSEAARDAVL
ncbi:sarcosine oxidase subunit gamma family protein [Phyllobacterium salinisoli]|uniref:Sarcosine oxidase subunit gamma family protein n=1 Tax=Phyllobacterium salinisoli TaxID=1899321 RepID=A0A368K3R8_9HYPH|nr:sarcosine oxidase subunit gamma [Phyllobacterium salinisoli]RCS23891.1 sarcosine oxidase subunit gamma family protein [Phyllobacterium salinisoli]